jgi:putative transposase
MSDRDKDIEVLALRHQLLVLQRQTGKPAFTDTDRAVLAGLLHHLPKDKFRHVLLLVRPDTILRWHRDLLKRRHAATCVPKRRGRPPTIRSIRTLVLRLAGENSSWGYRRIHGELAALGIKVAASTIWEILVERGIPPAPERQSTTWADFLRSRRGPHRLTAGVATRKLRMKHALRSPRVSRRPPPPVRRGRSRRACR